MKNLKMLVTLMLVLGLAMCCVGAGAETVLRVATDSSEEELSSSEIVDYLIETGFTEDQLVDVYSE